MMTIRCVLVALLATAAVAAPALDCPVMNCLQPCSDGDYMKDGCPTCDCITEVEFCTVARCPAGTLCDNDRRECVPFACSLPVCEEECKFGFIFDGAGCPLCDCAPDPCEDANCPTGTGCVVRLIAFQCIRAPCPSIYQAECVDPKVSCRPLRCPACRAGHVMVDGCPTCECINLCARALCPVGTRCDDTLQACVPLEACPPVCYIFCEFGKVLNANGCETCECNPDPCRDANCPAGTGCVVRLIALQCIRAPCPSIYQAECVDPKVPCRPLRCPACRAGHVMVDGCPTCECINPCATQICRRNYHCEVTRRDQTRCVRDLDSRRRPSV